MNVLDSRFLQVGDCFVQKFSKTGVFKYMVSRGTGLCMSVDDAINEIVVKSTKEDRNEVQQHNIVVKQDGAILVSEPARIEIKQGDMVLWNTIEKSIQGFAIVGQGKNGTFSSATLVNEAVYSHPFGTPGVYEWSDAYNGEVRGTVVVKDLDSYKPQDCRNLLEELSKGTLIKVNGHDVEPPKVEIVTGQTVFWAVEKSAGISITDIRYLNR